MCLQRDIPAGFLLPQHINKITIDSNSRLPVTNKAVTVLGPGNMTAPLSREDKDVPMNEQLKMLQISNKDKKCVSLIPYNFLNEKILARS